MRVASKKVSAGREIAIGMGLGLIVRCLSSISGNAYQTGFTSMALLQVSLFDPLELLAR